MAHTPDQPGQPHADGATGSRTVFIAIAAVVAVLAAIVGVLVLTGSEDPSGDRPTAAPSPTEAPSPTAAETSAGDTAATETPPAEPEPATRPTGIDAADPLAPWSVTAPDEDGLAVWSVPVFRTASVPNPTGAPPSGGSGEDLRLLADPQRARTDGSEQQLLELALTEAISDPPERRAYNGRPYGAAYENLWADGLALGSVEMTADATVTIDLTSGPDGDLLASGDEVSAQVAAYQQLAWTAAAILGDTGTGVVVTLDGDPRPLPATDEGDPVRPSRQNLAPVQILAPAEDSEQTGEVRLVALVAASTARPSIYLAGSGEDIFDTFPTRLGPEDQLGTGLRVVDQTLSLENALVPSESEVGVKAGPASDARRLQVVAD